MLGIFQKNSNNYESRVILSDMKKIFKQDTKTYNHLCRLDSNDGYLDSAIKNCNQAIKMNPKTPENYVYLAQSLSDKGESSLAGKNLIYASKKFKKSEFVQWATGQYYFKQKNFGVAKQYFLLASKVDSRSFRSFLNLGECYFELNEWENSYNSLKIACTLNESAIDKIREYSGRLRISKESEWSKKFSKLMYECKKN